MTSKRLLPALAAPLALLLLAGCGGSKDTPGDGKNPNAALTAAKATFDKASSVHFTLATDSKPTAGNGVLGADGVLTHQPAFKGDVKVSLGGLVATVPVVSVGQKVYAKLPLTVKYAVIDPAAYGAPDPADFVDPDTGISTLLTELAHVRKTADKRSGSQVLSIYTGTLSGDKVKPIIPSADANGTYKTAIGIDQDDEISTLEVTGDFFTGGGDETYRMTLDDYGKSVTISKP